MLVLLFFFFFLLEKVEIRNYNKYKLLIFIQKIEKPLNTHVSVCLEASWLIKQYGKTLIY